jgi:hypothetical protein
LSAAKPIAPRFEILSMTRYRRNFVPDGGFFFTVNLAERRLRLLTESIAALCAAFCSTRTTPLLRNDALSTPNLNKRSKIPAERPARLARFPVGRSPFQSGSNDMKRSLLIGVAAVALLASSETFAQGVGVGVGVGTTGVGAGITFEPAERTRIKEYIVKERVAPVTVKEKITVGKRLPADVELRSVPADWGPTATKYRYVYSDNNVYLVEPSSREVVTVID